MSYPRHTQSWTLTSNWRELVTSGHTVYCRNRMLIRAAFNAASRIRVRPVAANLRFLDRRKIIYYAVPTRRAHFFAIECFG